MGKPYKQPQKREVMAGSKLEIEMLQYSLNEANQKLAKKSADLNTVTRIMEQTTKVADQRKEKVDNLIKLSPRTELQMVCLIRSCWKWLTTAYPLNLGGLLTIAGLLKDSIAYCRL